ncbi:hypothetical protein BH09PSE4_BH09PSE4_20140 [soil metagenome]
MVDSIGAKPATAVDRQIAPVAASVAAKPLGAVAKEDGSDTNAVTLTDVAKELAKTPPIDAERIARIRKSIAAGTFSINPATIADRLLAHKLDWNPHDAA